jgi:uncharacterized protein YjbI with pentapeptide repeats
MAASIKASSQGLVAVEIARKRRGWTKQDLRWVEAANVSVATLKRFLSGRAISQDAFRAICEVVDLDWQQITELNTQHLHKLLIEGPEAWNEWKRLNPPLGYSLDNADLSNLNLRDVDLSGTSLKQANLTGANLENANLSRADLTSANLNGANLKGANLTAAQALSTVFTGATLTGVCLQDWNINQSTRLENVTCDYVFLKHISHGSSQRFAERRPSSGNFASGEFTALFQKLVETVDLIFANGIDWKAFFLSFQELQEKYSDSDLSIQSVERKAGGAFVIRLDVPEEANKSDIEVHAKALYQEKLRLLEMRYKAELSACNEQLEVVKQENSSLMNVVKQLASRPLNIVVESSGSSAATINFGGDIHGPVNVQSGTDVQETSTVNFGGDVHGPVNIGGQAKYSDVIKELQNLLNQITQLNPTVDWSEINEKFEHEIHQNSDLQSKIASVLKNAEAKEIEAILPPGMSVKSLQNLLEASED